MAMDTHNLKSYPSTMMVDGVGFGKFGQCPQQHHRIIDVDEVWALDYHSGHDTYEHEHSVDDPEEHLKEEIENAPPVKAPLDRIQQIGASNDDLQQITEQIQASGLVNANGIEEREDEDLEENGAPLLDNDFNATCRLAARLGASAMNNGSIAENIERYLPKLMEIYGYYGFFNCSTFVLSCNFEKRDPLHPDNTVVRTQNVKFEGGGFQLTKLGHLSDLAKDLMEFKINIQQANKLMDEIEAEPDPWGSVAMAMAFVVTGMSLPALLAGTWWDVLVAPLAGGLTYGIM